MLAKNIGKRCSIDETQLCEEVYTILSDKDGHGRKGSVIAIVKGTKADVVSQIIKKIPAEVLAKVEEITMDFSDSMYSIAKQCFQRRPSSSTASTSSSVSVRDLRQCVLSSSVSLSPRTRKQ